MYLLFIDIDIIYSDSQYKTYIGIATGETRTKNIIYLLMVAISSCGYCIIRSYHSKYNSFSASTCSGC